MVLKWGIISAGKISNDFVTALQLSSEDHKIVAVAARDHGRAEAFAKKFNIPKYYGNYKDLADDEDVDIAYIGVIHPEHLSVSEIMIASGKHILCEKPLTLNYAQTSKMIKLAQEKKVFLMEGIWSRCSPIYERLRQELKNRTIGEVRQVLVTFGANIHELDRLKQKILGGGGLLDIGIYCLQLTTLVFGIVEPKKIEVMGSLNNSGVDEYGSILMKFGNNGVSTMIYSCLTNLDNCATIIGTNGTIKILDPFFAPTKMLIKESLFEIKLPTCNRSLNFRNSEALMFEADYVKQCLEKGQLEAPIVPHSETLLWAKLMDKIRHSLGVEYEEDK